MWAFDKSSSKQLNDRFKADMVRWPKIIFWDVSSCIRKRHIGAVAVCPTFEVHISWLFSIIQLSWTGPSFDSTHIWTCKKITQAEYPGWEMVWDIVKWICAEGNEPDSQDCDFAPLRFFCSLFNVSPVVPSAFAPAKIIKPVWSALAPKGETRYFLQEMGGHLQLAL